MTDVRFECLSWVLHILVGAVKTQSRNLSSYKRFLGSS